MIKQILFILGLTYSLTLNYNNKAYNLIFESNETHIIFKEEGFNCFDNCKFIKKIDNNTNQYEVNLFYKNEEFKSIILTKKDIHHNMIGLNGNLNSNINNLLNLILKNEKNIILNDPLKFEINNNNYENKIEIENFSKIPINMVISNNKSNIKNQKFILDSCFYLAYKINIIMTNLYYLDYFKIFKKYYLSDKEKKVNYKLDTKLKFNIFNIHYAFKINDVFKKTKENRFKIENIKKIKTKNYCDIGFGRKFLNKNNIYILIERETNNFKKYLIIKNNKIIEQ